MPSNKGIDRIPCLHGFVQPLKSQIVSEAEVGEGIGSRRDVFGAGHLLQFK